MACSRTLSVTLSPRRQCTAERVNDFETAAERIECRCVFLLLTQHLACGHSRQRSYGHAVMRSCSHGQERFLSAQLRVAAMNRLEKLAALPLGQIRCGLPKRQSRVRRRPTAARVGYSASRDPSAGWAKSLPEATVLLLLFTSTSAPSHRSS